MTFLLLLVCAEAASPDGCGVLEEAKTADRPGFKTWLLCFESYVALAQNSRLSVLLAKARIRRPSSWDGCEDLKHLQRRQGVQQEA